MRQGASVGENQDSRLQVRPIFCGTSGIEFIGIHRRYDNTGVSAPDPDAFTPLHFSSIRVLHALPAYERIGSARVCGHAKPNMVSATGVAIPGLEAQSAVGVT